MQHADHRPADAARNFCRRIKRALEEWEDARSGQGSGAVVQRLANAAIAAGYCKSGPTGTGAVAAGGRWDEESEKGLRAQLEAQLWEQQAEACQALQGRLARMEAAVTELRQGLASLGLAGPDKAGMQAVSPGYVEELLGELVGALAEETALCRRLASGLAALHGREREQHLLLSLAWTSRPRVPEARLRALRDAMALELAS